MSTVFSFAKVGKRFGRSPREMHRLLPEIGRLEDRTLLSPFPPNIQNNLAKYLSPDAVITGFPTSVTPGETIHYSITISSAGVDDSFDPVFGYPYLAMSYVQQGSVKINGTAPDAPDGNEPIYYFPYSPGISGTPPDEPDPTIRPGDEQADVLQPASGDPYTGTIQITATIASDAPAGTVTEVPSNFPNLDDATGPWVFVVGQYQAVPGDNSDLPAWSTAMPFVVASDVPSFSTSSFFSSSTPTGTVGAPLAPSVIVNVLGKGGAVDTAFKGNVTLTLSGGASGASLINSSGSAINSVTVAAVNGVATFSGASAIIVNKIGSGYTLVASLTNGIPNPSPSFNIQGHTLKFADPPASSTAGDVMPVKVEVDDSAGSIDNTFTGNVQLQLADANGNAITDPTVYFEDPGGHSLGTTLTTSASGGTADFSKILYIDKPGTYTLIASIPNDSSTPSLQSSSFTLGVHQVKITLPNPMGGGPNETLPTVQVSVLDSQGNPDPNYDSDVVLALNGGLASGQSNGAALAGADVQVTGGSGMASFTTLMISKTGQNYSLTATLLTDAAPRDISGKFSVGDTIKFLTQPPASPLAGVPGEPLGAPPLTSDTPTPVQVEVDDSTGRPDEVFNGGVALMLAQNSFGAAISGGVVQVAKGTGIATFTKLSVNTVGTGYTLIASLPSDQDTATVTSNAFNVVPHDLFFKPVLPAPDNKAGVTGAPLHGAAPDNAPIEVDPLDAEGNVDSSYTGSIALTLNIIGQTNTDGKVATLLGPTGAPVPSIAVSGTAGTSGVLFPNVIISEPGRYSLTATAKEPGAPAAGTITDTSGQFIIGSDTPVIESDPPKYIGSNESFGSPIIVDVQNNAGQVDTDFTGNVTMTIVGLSNSGQTPALGGQVTQPAKAGVATFSGLTVNLLGAGYALVAKMVDGTSSDSSTAFSVVPETLKFLQTEFPDPAGVPGQPITPAIQLGVYLQAGTDSSGQPNLILDTQFNNAGKPVTLSLGENAAGATLQNASGVISAGIITYSTLSISKASGENPGYTLIPSDGNSNDIAVPSPQITIASHTLSFDSAFEPVASVINQPMNQTIVVNVNDLSGEPDTSYNGPVTLTLEGGSLSDPDTGDVVPSITVNAISGRAHFFHPIAATAGTLLFAASIDEPGKPDAYSTAFQVTAPGPVTQSLQTNSTVVTAGQTITTTDVLNTNSSSPVQVQPLIAALPEVRTLAQKKPKSNAKPTGTVLFEEGSVVLKRVKVQVVHGVAEAKAKLKLTVPGLQTISAVYEPSAASKKLGLSATTVSTVINVLPAPPKKSKGSGKH